MSTVMSLVSSSVTTEPTVTVVVPSRGASTRVDEIVRALASIASQEGVSARACVVLNGQDPDPTVVADLRTRPDIDLIERGQASLPGAIAAGLEAANSSFVTVLDDDDFLLPGALGRAASVLEKSPSLVGVVANGIVRGSDGDSPSMSDVASIRRDPLAALLERNWLLPGSWLARRVDLPGSFNDSLPTGGESTTIAVRLVLAGPVEFLTDPAVVWHADRSDSIRRSRPADGVELALVRHILSLPLPRAARRGFRRRLGRALHSESDRQRARDRPLAWRLHASSLRQPGGLRYLSYTRRLLSSREATS